MKPLLHSLTARQLAVAIASQAAGHLFHGPEGVGKRLAAREYARQLNCQGDEGVLCRPCRQLESGVYPDSIIVEPEDRPSITIEQIRRLVSSLSLRSYRADGVRVVIIDQADQLTVEAQNALLKIIEEPPAGTRFILVVNQPETLLTTVRSRLAALYFAPVSTVELAEWLVARHGAKPAEADRLAGLADGAPGIAVRLLTDQTQADTLGRLYDAAGTLLQASLFERLVLVRQLADEKASGLDIANWVQRAIMTAVRQGQVAAAAQRLQAVEQLRRGLQANVVPRVALERLALELGHG
jgi:DNA polymerase III subunit delta'